MAAWRFVRQAGFTLVEVLVALAVVSFALLAGLRVAGQGTNSVNELRSHLCAHWVAQNLLELQRARGEWLPLGIGVGNDRQGGIEYSWREEVVATPNAAFRRVNITVFGANDESHSLARLTGFVVKPY